MGDYIRAFSEAQFSKEHRTPEVRGHGLWVGLVSMVIMSVQDEEFLTRKMNALSTIDRVKVRIM